MIGFDQRGTGRAGCCAARAGARRAVALERRRRAAAPAARRAAGVLHDAGLRAGHGGDPPAAGARKLTLFGISYGTELALAYARAYPARVDRLDARFHGRSGRERPVRAGGLPRDGADTAVAVPCALPRRSARIRRPTCRRWWRRCGAAPLRGDVYTPRGERRRRAVTPAAMADLMYDADYAPAMRAAIPSAVRAALAGDAAPMLRLLRLSAELRLAVRPARVLRRPLRDGVRGDAAAMAARDADRRPATAWRRSARWRSRRRRSSRSTPRVAYADEIDLCLRWPDPGQPPAPKGAPYPAVPALLLQGDEDLRTPPEASAHLATLFPACAADRRSGRRARDRRRRPERLRASASSSASCAAGRVRARCPRVDTGVPETGVPPASFGSLAPAAGFPARVGRTVAAVDATLDDLDLAVSPGDLTWPRRRAARRVLAARGRGRLQLRRRGRGAGRARERRRAARRVAPRCACRAVRPRAGRAGQRRGGGLPAGWAGAACGRGWHNRPPKPFGIRPRRARRGWRRCLAAARASMSQRLTLDMSA